MTNRNLRLLKEGSGSHIWRLKSPKQGSQEEESRSGEERQSSVGWYRDALEVQPGCRLKNMSGLKKKVPGSLVSW